MDKKLEEVVADAVAKIFATKEEADQRKKTIAALEASANEITSLKADLEQANIALEQSAQDLEAAKAEVASLNEKLGESISEADVEAAKIEAAKVAVEAKEAAEAKLEKVSLELSTMKKEIIAAERMTELESAGVLRDDSESQKAKITDMDDASFAAYKDELVEVKEQVIASLQKSLKTEAADDNGITPPANIDPHKSEQASLNLETASEGSIESKMKELGEALAEMMTKDK